MLLEKTLHLRVCLRKPVDAFKFPFFATVPMRVRHQLDCEGRMFRGVKVLLEVRKKFRSSIVAVGHLQGIQESFTTEVGVVTVQFVEVDFAGSGLIT